MPNISIKTFEVWNIERAGYGHSTIELITIFNVDDIHSNVSYQIFNSKNERIYNVKNRFYNKGEPLYPKISPQSAPKGEITIVAWLVNNLNEKISDFATKVLYLKNAVPASGIGQAADVPLPEFPEATREATSTAQSPSAIAEKVHREREEAYVSPIEARAQLAQKAITEPAPITVTEPILPEISILPKVYAEPEVINTQVTTNMIRQELVNFTIENNRIQGSIKFTATNSFNPYYYNKEIINYLQLKSNDKIILIKTNRLRFTETERDELINFNEYAYNLDSINSESYVWTGADLAMANTLQFTIEAGKETKVTNGTGGLMGAGVLGVIGILMLSGFIADHVRRKR